MWGSAERGSCGCLGQHGHACVRCEHSPAGMPPLPCSSSYICTQLTRPPRLPELCILHKAYNLGQRRVGAHPAPRGRGAFTVSLESTARWQHGCRRWGGRLKANWVAAGCRRCGGWQALRRRQAHLEARMRSTPPMLMVPPITASPTSLCTGTAAGGEGRGAVTPPEGPAVKPRRSTPTCHTLPRVRRWWRPRLRRCSGAPRQAHLIRLSACSHPRTTCHRAPPHRLGCARQAAPAHAGTAAATGVRRVADNRGNGCREATPQPPPLAAASCRCAVNRIGRVRRPHALPAPCQPRKNVAASPADLQRVPAVHQLGGHLPLPRRAPLAVELHQQRGGGRQLAQLGDRLGRLAFGLAGRKQGQECVAWDETRASGGRRVQSGGSWLAGSMRAGAGTASRMLARLALHAGGPLEPDAGAASARRGPPPPPGQRSSTASPQILGTCPSGPA